MVAELAAGSVICLSQSGEEQLPASKRRSGGDPVSGADVSVAGQTLAIWENGRPTYSLDKWPTSLPVRVKPGTDTVAASTPVEDY